MQRFRICTGNTADSIKTAKTAISRWGKNGDISVLINYNPSKIDPKNPKTYPLQIKTGDVQFSINDVASGYRGIGPLGTIEILRFLGIPVKENEIFSCTYKKYSISKENRKMRYNEIAAKYWRDKLATPASDKLKYGVLSSVAIAYAAKANISKHELDLFEERLSKEIENKVKRFGKLTLGSDFGPIDLLTEVANSCNIPQELFPLQTIMIITTSRISVYVEGKEKIIFKA